MRIWRYVVLLAAVACVDPTNQKGLTGAAGITVNVVDVSGFTPQTVTITPGTTLTWAWAGNNTYTHNVTFTDTTLASSNLISGTFQAGTYHYHCTVHGEQGVVSVH
jgi:plastocyanin